MKIKWLMFFISALFLQSCNYVDVRSEYDTSANFRSFQTFNIRPITNVDEYNVNEFAQQHIINAINSELNARGYTQASRNADLTVESYISTKDKVEISAETSHRGHGDFSTRYDTYEYTEGTLIIDIRNAKTNKLVWQGVGMGVIDRSPKNREQRLSKVIAKIFRDFPIEKYE